MTDNQQKQYNTQFEERTTNAVPADTKGTLHRSSRFTSQKFINYFHRLVLSSDAGLTMVTNGVILTLCEIVPMLKKFDTIRSP